MTDALRECPHVVIVGAGFGGLRAARRLRKAPVRVTVVDRYNHHLFQPLLYQVATAVLSPGDISSPVRHLVRRARNTTVLLAEARHIDTARKVLHLDSGELPYDMLVLATGATHSYFGHPEWAPLAPGLKTLDDARLIRERILLAFEAAERETDPEQKKAWLTFVVIGGGPTGVELAGALAELCRRTLPREYRRIDTRDARIFLLEGLPRVLPIYPETLSEHARRSLQRLGVQVRTGTMVTGIDEEGVMVGERRIPARTVLWGAGVAASPLARSLEAELDRAGRVKVEPTLTVPGKPDVFVVGDLVSLQQEGKPVPGLAPAAIQMGRHVAANIQRRVDGQPLVPFHYKDRGSFAVIGRGAAVGQLYGMNLHGRVAYFAWFGIHVLFLVGFRNRVSVLLDWAYTALTHRRNARLITRQPFPLPRLQRRLPDDLTPHRASGVSPSR